MPGNFARSFFEATIAQQTSLYQLARQINNNSIIKAFSNQTVDASVIHDIADPNSDYNVYLSDVASLDGFNIETNDGPSTIIRIRNPNSHTVYLRTPTNQILSSSLDLGELPAVGDFNTLTATKTTTNEIIVCRLFQTSGNIKAWALID
jgi:hypothetical protein